MRTVWIVTQGDELESGDLVSVHADHQAAVNAALQISPRVGGCWELNREDLWFDGGDFIQVTEHIVQ